MGGEFAQEREWNHDAGLDWHLLADPFHSGVQRWCATSTGSIARCRRCIELDCEPQGFEWIDASDSDQSVLAYLRRGRDPDAIAVVVCNFTPVPRPNYRIGVPLPGRYVERLNTDCRVLRRQQRRQCRRRRGRAAVPWHGRPHSICV